MLDMLAALGNFVIGAVGLVLGSVLGWWVFRLADFSAELRPILRSIIFQGTLALLALYAASSGGSVLASAFLLSALVKSFFLQYQDYKSGRLTSWFSILKDPLGGSGLVIYFSIVGALFLYSLINFVF